MHAFGGALQCLKSFSSSSLASSGLSIDGSVWPSFSSGSSADTALSDLAYEDAGECFTVEILEDSPSHPFLVRSVRPVTSFLGDTGGYWAVHIL